MGFIGFILLLIGGGLLIYKGVSLAFDPATAGLLITLINTYIAPHVGIPNLGQIVVVVLTYATSLGGFGVVVGALIWYFFGEGFGAFIGKIVVSLSTFGAFFIVAMHVYFAWQAGVFSQPLHLILGHFAGLGLGFAGVALCLIGDFLGAGRKIQKGPDTEAV